MKKQLIVTGLVIAALGAGITSSAVQDPMQPPEMEGMPEFPEPQAEHEWLNQLVGEWTFDSEMSGPGMPPMKATGTDSVRSLGGRWIIAELNAEMPGIGSITAILQLGYNSETGKYQGTWIDSMTDHMWVYVGTMDASGKKLTLEAEGPNMMDPTSTELVKYHDVIEIKSADHRTLTSFAQDETGQWVQYVTANYHRK